MKKDKLLIIAFLGIIFGVFLIYPCKYILVKMDIFDFQPTDNWKYYKPSGNKIYDKIMSLETSITNITNNYFPLYSKINSNFNNINKNVNLLFSDKVFIKTNNDNEYIMYNKEYDFYYLINNLNKEELLKRIDKQTDFYNELSLYNANLYIYLPLRYELTGLASEHDLSSYVQIFKNKLNKNIYVDELSSITKEEYLKYFYKTDHHYNANGALVSYKKILKMMNLTDNNNYEIINVKDNYYGSMAKNTLIDKTSDNLTDIKNNINIPVIKDSKFKPRKILNKNKFYDYYIGYFNGQYDEIVYNFNKQSDRNLLIFSDSLSWQIDYLLANNFNNTYVINMRYGKWVDNDLNIKAYLSEHQITDILFLQEAENTMFDLYNHNIEKRVK